MVFPIAGGNESKGYEVENSLRFNRADTAYLTKSSIGSTTGSGKTFTFSTWVKRSGLGSEQYIIHARSADSQGNFARLEFDSGDAIRFRGYSTTYLDTNRVFRDPSAWYNIVLAVDTDTSGDGNSVRLYVNGVEETSFATDNNPSTDDDLILGSDRAHFLGASYYNNSAAASFDGYMADVYLIDGQQLAPTSFGKFDDNGVWIPKKYTGTFGGNGFKFEFQQTGTSANSSGIGADTSGNDSHFTVTNLAATDVTEDTCTNNFATWNTVIAMNSTTTIAEGNLEATTGSNYANYASNAWFSSIGVSSGKWYAEFKESAGTNNQGQILGVAYNLSKFQQGSSGNSYGLFDNDNGWGYLGAEGIVKNNGSNVLTSLSTWTVGDIVCIALDMDNHKLYFRKNGGSWENSGNPESGSTGTGAISLTTGETYFFACSDASLSNTYTFQANFGNPVHSITSSNNDGKYGNFEYAVPSGYYALCTKNLAEFG